MTIGNGSQLGPYEILAPIGAGGMGEVYKARDTRLDRTVAIKVLPEHLSKDPALRERFEREARAVSSLNHPHICTLYDVGEDDGVHFLVMEYIEGETLADRLKKGALPLELALEYSVQIADALHSAHREGVVHRDLKPGNVMLTKPGIKLLDFGLAKTREEKTAPTEDSEQPTRHKPLTDAGTILGTVQYMAPEQLEGKEIDARADLFAFGAMLYEMLTGHKAFEGESQASLISAIMSTEPPPVSGLQPVSPPALDRVVKKCLAKDPEARWQTARDLWDELTWIRTRPEMEPSAPAPISKRSRRSPLAAVLVALGVAATIWYVWPRPSPPRVTRFAITGEPPPGAGSRAPSMAMSRDGRYLATVVMPGISRNLVVRDMSALEVRELRGTEGMGHHPFFSPDGEWIAFNTRGQLRKIPVGGGTPQIICNFEGVFSGGSWSSDDRILFSSRSSLHLVPADGGNVETLLQLDDEAESLLYPRWLPGGRHALVTVKHGFEETLHSLSLKSRELRKLIPNASQAHYLASGHLFFRRNLGGYFAVRFAPDPPSLLGEPVKVAVPIWSPSIAVGSFFALSESGTLAYVPNRNALIARLLWSDPRGLTTPLPIEPDVFRRPSLSPNGRRLAVDIHRGGPEEHDIWIYNLGTGARNRLTVEGHNAAPVWTPDGRRVAFASRRPETTTGTQRIFWQSADGSGDAELLLAMENEIYPVSFSPDGKTLALVEFNQELDIWVLPLGQDPVPLLTTPFREHSPMFSPDGRWLAYVSDESGLEEVYVRGFPGEGPKHPISTGGGRDPIWSRDGRKLYYRGVHNAEMWAVAVELEPTFQGSKPELLFTRRFFADTNRQQTYDVSLDGKRFLVVEENDDRRSQEVVVVINWVEELKRLVPVE